jgi:hypothetical protein
VAPGGVTLPDEDMTRYGILTYIVWWQILHILCYCYDETPNCGGCFGAN